MKVTKKCAFCGQSFETRSGMQRYCSEACQAEAKRAKVMQEQPLQAGSATHGDTTSGVSHLFQSSHPHGLFPSIHL